MNLDKGMKEYVYYSPELNEFHISQVILKIMPISIDVLYVRMKPLKATYYLFYLIGEL